MLEWRVSTILEKIKAGGDSALREVIEEVEDYVPAELKVSEDEFEAAVEKVPVALRQAIDESAARIETIHRSRIPMDQEWTDGTGGMCRRRYFPVRRVGLYVPGGEAPLISIVLTLGTLSRLAGCRERIICTPPSEYGAVPPSVLYAASVCGVKDVYKVGGAQAIAAMAYGTDTIGKVDKIFGPGDRSVMKAKGIASKEGIAVDLTSGPTETMILSDESAKVRIMAADFLAQAEQSPDSQVILLCGDITVARMVLQEIDSRKRHLPRKDIIEDAMAGSRIIVFRNLDDRVAFANMYAPGRLILAVKDPEEVASRIEAAGLVVLGHHSPGSACDYVCGAGDILPTGGAATAWGGIGVESFTRSVIYQSINDEGLASLAKTMITLAEAETFQARAEAVNLRL